MLDFDISYIPGSEHPGLELQDVLLARIHRRQASSMMGRLAPAVPLTGLQHVKRLRKPPEAADGQPCLDLLLCALPHEEHDEVPSVSTAMFTSWTAEQAAAAGAPEAVVQLVVEHSLLLRRGRVAKAAPQTREQWTEWGQIWPLNWRQPDVASTALPDTLSPEEAAAMGEHMRATLALAEAARCDSGSAAGAPSSDPGSRLPDQAEGGAHGAEHGDGGHMGMVGQQGAVARVHNAALIVNPATGQTITQGLDGTSGQRRHPLAHAVMAAIAAAAERDLRMWPDGATSGCTDVPVQAAPPVTGGSRGGAACAAVEPECSSGVGAAACAAGEPECSRGVGAAACEAREPECSSGGSQQPDRKRQRLEEQPLVGSSRQGRADLHGDGGATSGPEGQATAQKSYLCTGFDCYVVREPCAMCAMALVHSRVRRVIYCKPDTSFGALGGAFRLHGQRSLNHHYQVYKCAAIDGQC